MFPILIFFQAIDVVVEAIKFSVVVVFLEV